MNTPILAHMFTKTQQASPIRPARYAFPISNAPKKEGCLGSAVLAAGTTTCSCYGITAGRALQQRPHVLHTSMTILARLCYYYNE